MIDTVLLQQYGAKVTTYKKGEYVFYQGCQPLYFNQVLTGKVKMNNYNEKGKEFIQSIFYAGQSFGDPPLFLDNCYASNAVAIVSSTVIQISKEKFLVLLSENIEASLAMNKSLAKGLYYKLIMSADISSADPTKRILTLFEYLKSDELSVKDQFCLALDLTRQQIADLTGLRVETVIRTVKKMEEKKLLRIVNGKILI